jgi:UDP-N-acetylglucosamine acyltransferase
MARIHPSALVDPAAELAEDVEVGPFSVIGPGLRIGAGTRIGPHVVLDGQTTIGRDNRIFSFCSLGSAPQDKKYAGEPTRLVIGDGNTIREYCLFNTGTVQGGGQTRIGSDNWIMGHAHVAHDCIVGDHTIIANGVPLGGHVRVGDWAIIGGTSAVHQFVRIGAHAMCGGGTILTQDLPPFVICSGVPAQPHGLNAEGLKRRDFSAEAIAALRRAYRLVYRENLPLTEARVALDALIAETAAPDVAGPLRTLADFLAEPGRGIIR